jgi:hypothetical protein
MREPRPYESGLEMKKIREKLLLRYRDVSEASQRIARQHGNAEFAIGLSRLADIENKGTVPSIYRMYSLAAIYSMELKNLLAIFGVNLSQLPADSLRLAFPHTRAALFDPNGKLAVEMPLNTQGFNLDVRATSYLSRQIHKWGKLPVLLLQSLDLRNQRYAFIGTEDWSMHPLVRPGSFVQIDESRRQIKRDTSAHDFERPIYFLEHRHGFRCGWCTLTGHWMIVQSHPASTVPPAIFKYPGEVDVIGQIVAVAMRLDREKRRRTDS